MNFNRDWNCKCNVPQLGRLWLGQETGSGLKQGVACEWESMGQWQAICYLWHSCGCNCCANSYTSTGTAVGSTKNNTLLARVLHKMNWEIKIAICHTYFIAFCVLDSPLRLTLGHLTNTKYGIRNTAYGVRERLLDTHRTRHTKCQTRFNLRCVVQLRVPCLGQVQPRSSGAR